MNKKQWLCALTSLIIVVPVGKDILFNFVVWNVGQGSWSTFIKNEQCFHFDMGGEKFNINQLKPHCKGRDNLIFITHMDWDHISFIYKFNKFYKSVCVFYPKKIKKRWLKKISPCQKIPKEVRVLSYGNNKKDRNASSIVYLIQNQILITGDAPMSEEKKWYKKVPRNLSVLVVGHHGSNTSTSKRLLDWARPRTVIISARKGKYGHPHKNVVKKLRKSGARIFTSETHGNILLKIKKL